MSMATAQCWQTYNVAEACTVQYFYRNSEKKKKHLYLCADGMGGECFWVQHYCNENWWALVWITGMFFLSVGGILDYWKK